MHSKHHLMLGSFLALSAILLLATLMIPATAMHDRSQENIFSPRFPPKGSAYAIDIDGSAKIAGKPTVKPVSADIELKVVNVKTKGVPTIYLELTAGKFSLGDVIYELDKGNAVIQGTKVNIKATSKDGTKILTISAVLGDALPIKTTEDPVKLLPGQDRKSASIRILAQQWILTFGGSISRTA